VAGPHLVEVAFKGNRKEFFTWDADEPPPLKAAVIVDADRGEDLGHVHALGELAQKRCVGCAHGCGAAAPARRALRLATPSDLRQERDVRSQDETARRKGAERVKAHGLVMKMSDAEWQWDRKKLTFYFTAEKRVDFRNLVRDLASLFRARIELKQIGVRDEAKRLDGVGRCGRQYCSASWLPELRPVNLGVAKDQRLSLNPSQISGACGRLMCCLRYEHEFYVQSRKKFPKEGKTVTTAKGEEKVVSNDIFNERVTLRGVDGETRIIALAAFRTELSGGGAPEIPDAVVDLAASADIPELADLDEIPPDTGTYQATLAARALTRAQTPPPAPPAPAPAAAEAEAEAAGEQPAGAPKKRRRGRRGGRRGRGKGASGQNAPPMPPSAGDQADDDGEPADDE
jgi:cell fate regulator YaaT (PSP1 superfamily)